ncbi:MAG: hypothetical protein AAGA87_11740 [Pseudomonadota bacterium]
MARLILTALVVGALAAPASAGAIRSACLSTGQGAPGLCGCIQAAADRTMSKRDQRMAARFFRDPDRAQEIRMSDRPSHEQFWDRYKAFSATAEAFCS